MRSIRDVRGLGAPRRSTPSEGVQARVFRAGQSSEFTRAGFICIAVAGAVWVLLLLLNPPLALIWTGICVVALISWAAVYWTVGDSDTPETQKAQSTPGLDQGFIDQQARDVIHEHDHD